MMYLLISRASPGISKELFPLDLMAGETIVGRFLQTSRSRVRNGNFCSRTIRRQFVFGNTDANSMRHLCNSSAGFFSRSVRDEEKHKIRHFQKNDTTIHENTLIEKSGSRKILESRRVFYSMSNVVVLDIIRTPHRNRQQMSRRSISSISKNAIRCSFSASPVLFSTTRRQISQVMGKPITFPGFDFCSFSKSCPIPQTSALKSHFRLEFLKLTKAPTPSL